MTNEKTPHIAQLIVDGKTYALPVLVDSFGDHAIDIRGLFEKTRIMMFDPGFTSTAGCESEITYIDGKKSLLLYRGYPIEQIAKEGSFIETAYLLLKGELPTAEELCEFDLALRFEKNGRPRALIDEQMIEIVKRNRRNTPPMLLVETTVSELDAFYNHIDYSTPAGRDEIALNLIAKIPTIVALAFRFTRGDPLVYPRADLGYTENFIRMCFAHTDSGPYDVSKTVVHALDQIFILHADHEQNASTATVRLAGSTGISPHSAVSTGVSALWGKKHGGANEAVLKMLSEIGSVDNIPAYIERIKDKSSGLLLYGFGHRVYKSMDPRAMIMCDSCHKVLDELGIKDPLLDVARELEQRALKDDYFIKNNLYPNVDFYSGIVLKALGFPPDTFTTLFALARTLGWVAQWKEMVESGPVKIGRPRQHYTGYEERPYVPMALRGPAFGVSGLRVAG